MALSERLLGKRNLNGRPRIERVDPPAALPGGEVRIVGSGLKPPELTRPRVQIDEVDVPIVVSSDDFVHGLTLTGKAKPRQGSETTPGADTPVKAASRRVSLHEG